MHLYIGHKRAVYTTKLSGVDGTVVLQRPSLGRPAVTAPELYIQFLYGCDGLGRLGSAWQHHHENHKNNHSERERSAHTRHTLTIEREYRMPASTALSMKVATLWHTPPPRLHRAPPGPAAARTFWKF